jgi:hypothetical protein
MYCLPPYRPLLYSILCDSIYSFFINNKKKIRNQGLPIAFIYLVIALFDIFFLVNSNYKILNKRNLYLLLISLRLYVYRRRKIVESFLKFSPILIEMPNIFIQQMHINPKGGIELISQPGPFVFLSCFFWGGGGGWWLCPV